MKKLLHFYYLIIFCIVFSAVFSTNSFAQLTVSTTGTDTGNCQGSPCLTIQYAINQAVATNIITVGAGTFAGFNVNKALTINGININNSPNEVTTNRAIINGTAFINLVAVPETIINTNITVVSNDVTINGFEIINANVTCNSSNFKFLFNKLNPSTATAGLDQISPTTVTNWEVKDNRLGHSNIVFAGIGLRLAFINGLIVERNYIWRARSGGIAISDVINATVLRNVINQGIQNNAAEPAALRFRGSPAPPIPNPISVGEFGVQVGSNCSNVKILENEIVAIINTDANALNDAGIRIFASALTGNLLLQGNIIQVARAILIPSTFSSYTNSFITILENRLNGIIETSDGTPTGNINANGNSWNLAVEPNANPTVLNTGGIIGASKVQRITFIYTSIDVSVATTGFQTTRVTSYDDTFIDGTGLFTMQRAINATPRDNVFRWTLEPGYTTATFAISDVQINKPMILKGDYNNGIVDNITANATAASQLFAITSDSVTIKNFNITVNNTIPTAILVKGNREQSVENVTFNSLATSDFSYIKIDNDKIAGAPPMSATLLNNTFRSPVALNGTGILFSNTSKTVSSPDVNYITLTTNIFENNLRYFLRMDETIGKEFTYSPNVSNNTYTLATVVIPPPASTMTLPQLFDLEDRFIHGIDIPNVAFFNVVPNNFYVTPISFYAPTTTTPNINRAISISPVAGIINIKNATYTMPTTITKSLVFKPSGAVIVNNLTVNAPSGLLSVDGDLRIGTSLTLTDGHIANIAGQFILNPTFTTLTGGNANSYVRTPLTADNTGKVSPFSLNFPIGDPTVNNFRPLLMSGVSGTGTVLRANTDLAAGGTANGTNLNSVLGTRFWNLKTISGTLTNAGTITANYGIGDGVTVSNVVALSLATSSTQNGTFGSITATQGGVGAPTGTIAGASASLPADAFLRVGITCGSIAAPILSISSPSQICEGQSGTLVINNPQVGFFYTWLGPGLPVLGQQGTTITIPSTFIGVGGSTGTYNVFLTDGIGCQSANTSTLITIITQPLATFLYSAPSFCNTAANPTPTITNTGGAFSAMPSGLSLNATTGQITLSTSTAGTYTVTYNITASGGCGAATATQSVSVSTPASAVINTTATLVNVNEVLWCSGNITLNAVIRTDYQYQWKLNGTNIPTAITSTYLASAAGDYTVEITNGCGVIVSNIIRLILSVPNATFSYSQTNYCKPSANAVPTITSMGGTFSAAPSGLSLNTSTGEINITTSTDGNYIVTYSIGGANGCTATTSTKNVNLSTPASAVISTTTPLKNVNQIFWCSGDVTLTAVSRPDYQYQWKKNGVNIGTLGSNVLIVSDLGDYSVDIINGCGTITSNIIRLMPSNVPNFTINALPTTTVGLGSSITLNSTLISTPSGGETYLWEGADLTANPSIITTNASVTFDVVLGGTYKLTISNGLNCVSSKTIDIATVSDFYVPNTFSPNGEGDVKNEKFLFYGSAGISEIEFKIYDRLGKLVYQANNINELLTNGWDGTYSGAALPAGSYVWYLAGKKINGEALNYQGKTAGTLMLIR